jgi:hypothetical protein
MDMQAAPPTYAEMNTGRPPVGNPPVLGQQIPGMTGGLPSQGGLSVLANPMARQLQSFGRGDDSMLVHMTPGEVNSLQGLAMATGGSLTINPHTGLPEAGWLGKLLPTILGAALAATGVGAPLAAGIVGAGQFARTGSLKKGLMAGLGAFGGAGMAGMAGLGGSITNNAFGALSNNAGFFGANMGQGISQAGNIANLAKMGTAPVENAINVTANTGAPGAYTGQFSDAVIPGIGQGASAGAIAPSGYTGQFSNAVIPGIGQGASAGAIAPSAYTGQFSNAVIPGLGSGVSTAAQTATTGAQFTGGLGSRFGQAVRAGLPGGTPGIISKAAPMMAGMGALQNISGAMTPSMGTMGSDGVVDNSYAGPYTAQKRTPSFAKDTSEILGSSKERRYFDIDMPEVYNVQGQIVQPGSSTARGTPILQNVLNPKAKKGQNRYNQIFTPYMGGVDPEEGYAGGGEVELADGAFVLDARTVSEMGNGSSNAGKEALRRIGGRPIEGPGDGVSDSIPARIGRSQPARVARDEVVVPAQAVRKLGKGNPKRGADKLYALMDKAHKARKKAKRGQDTKLRRGLV